MLSKKGRKQLTMLISKKDSLADSRSGWKKHSSNIERLTHKCRLYVAIGMS